jgi:hypothetical protein
MTTRGIRNRNPLNLVHSPANNWQGLDDPPSDGRMCRFKADQWGIRAAGMLLRTYRAKYKLVTIRQLVERWAPASENNPAQYARVVSEYMGKTPDYAPNLDDPMELENMLRGMCRMENGEGPFDGEWYTNLVWEQGVKLALQPLSRSRTMLGSAAAGAATAGQALLDATQEALPQATEAATTVSWLWPEIAQYVLIAVALAGVGVAMYARFSERKEGVT